MSSNNDSEIEQLVGALDDKEGVQAQKQEDPNESSEEESQEAEIDKILEQAAPLDIDGQFVTIQATKKTLQHLQDLLVKNQEARQSNDPKVFMESEGQLYDYLRTNILPISAVQEDQLIQNFISSDGIEMLIELLDHANSDISVNCATKLLQELTDEEISQDVSQKIVEKFMDNQGHEQLIQLLQSHKDEGIIELIENLVDLGEQKVADKFIGSEDTTNYILLSMQTANGEEKWEDFQSYSDLLSMLLQKCSVNLKEEFAKKSGIKNLVSIIDQYQGDGKIKMQIEDQYEAMVNLLTSLL